MSLYQTTLPDGRRLSLGWDIAGQTYFLQAQAPTSRVPHTWIGQAYGQVQQTAVLEDALAKLRVPKQVVQALVSELEIDRAQNRRILHPWPARPILGQ